MKVTTQGVSAIALMIGFGLASATSPVAAQQSDELQRQSAPAFCDDDGNGQISEFEAQQCAQRGYGEWSEEEGYISEDRFGEMYPEVEDRETAFSTVDSDGDGQISEDEWMSWQEQAFTEATGDSGGEMTMEDYESWWEGGVFE